MTNLSRGGHRLVTMLCCTAWRRDATGERTQSTMKTKNIVCSMLALGLIAGGLTACVTEKENEGKEAKLEAQAKVTKAEAEKIALAKVPGGTIQEGELEKEKRKLIWSFDIS